MDLVRVSDAEGARDALPDDADVVVCVPIFNAYTQVVQCLNGLLAHTDPSVPILLLDDGSVDPRLLSLSVTTTHTVVLWHRPENLGFVATVNKAFQLTTGSDPVIVNSDVVVGPEWLDRLRAVAYSSSNVATATPLTNHGTMLSVGNGRNHASSQLPGGLLPAQAAERVARVSPQLRPLIPTAIGHCTYFRRPALDIVGIFDEIFSPGYSEEVDFSQRALAMGFVHVCADDVFVFHEGGSSFGRSDKLKALILEHDELVRQRYPYYFHWVRATEKDPGSPLAATLLVADAALRGIRLVVDGSNLGPTNMGTQTVTLESVKALTRHAAIAEVTVLVPESAPASALAELGQCGAKVLVSGGRTRSWQRRLNADIVYRPSQVTRVSELERLLAMARRLVIWQLDCIAYNNPAYFVDWSRWAIYRRANQLAFRLADGIAFLSQTSFRDARTSGLVASGRTAVVYPGTNTERTLSEPKAPPGISGSESGFFLCLGVSYKHKNRVAAMRIWQEARAQGWEGGLVLAGPSPPQGDSLADEDEFLLAHPELKSSVWRLDVLSSDEKEWLYERAALVLYPSIVEGFGLVPFEAAARNVPCLSTRGGALDEVLPTDIPTINLEDVAATASCALELASDGPLRKALCGSLKARAVDFTWDRTADSLVNFFWAVMSQPSQERDRVAELSSKTVARAGLGARSWVFTKTYPLVSWGIAQVVERPRLRRFLLPRGSLRFRLGRAIVRSVDRKTR